VVWLLRKCIKCKRYTLNQNRCPYCNQPVKIPHPAKFSPDDKYIKYKLDIKKEKITT